MFTRANRTQLTHRQPSRSHVLAGVCCVAASVLGVGFVADAGTNELATGQLSRAEAEVFAGIEPVRLLDTRSGGAGPFGPAETRTIVAGGVMGVPSNATSIAINMTIPGSATETSFVTVWPSGASRPDTSTSNATPGQAVPNFVVTGLGAGGAIDVFNERGETHVMIDVVGYYVALSSVEAEVSEEPQGEPISSPTVLADDGAPAGSLGAVGDVYIDTALLSIYGPKSIDGWGAGAPIGPDGVSAAFTYGQGAPSEALGDEGDSYLDVDAVVLYGPRSEGAWGSGQPLLTAASVSATHSAVGASVSGATLYGKSELPISFADDVLEVGSAMAWSGDREVIATVAGTYKVSYSIDASGGSPSAGVDLRVADVTKASFDVSDAEGNIDDVRLIAAEAGDTIKVMATGLENVIGLNVDGSIVIELVAVD